MSSGSLIYVSFDRFPSPKGAATHIAAFISALAHDFANIDLVTVAGPAAQPKPALPNASIRHSELLAIGPSLIERVLCFRANLRSWWGQRRPRVAHVRSIFEGYPIARRKRQWCDKLVFEVNGLPSIELKYHYPRIADDREMMRKLLAQEQTCLDEADLIVTVSNVNAAHLVQRGVDSSRLCVIPNGVDPDLFHYQSPREWGQREISLLYSGTLSSWQGLPVAIEALSLYLRDAPARLTIVGAGRSDQIRALRQFADALDVDNQIQIVSGVSQPELAQMHHAADIILVPLAANDRNLVQGCCPLKLLEGMSSGTPVIASDMPVVSEIASNEVNALLVRPGSAKAIKDALLRYRSDSQLRSGISQNARACIEHRFTWEIAKQRLRDAYQTLL